MESYRVYKSLPVDDFMEMTAFVMAKAGVSLIPLIQDFNHFRKTIENHTDAYLKKRFAANHTDEYLKEEFIAKVRKLIDSSEDRLIVGVDVFEDVKYYMFLFKKKVDQDKDVSYASVREESYCEQQNVKCMCNNCPENRIKNAHGGCDGCSDCGKDTDKRCLVV